MTRSMWWIPAVVALTLPGSACVKDSAAEHESRTPVAKAGWMAGLDSLSAAVSRLETAVRAIDHDTTSIAQARGAFRDARRAYKRIEFVVAYYEPTTAKLLNGPALPRVEHDEGPEAVFPPEGFQVIEELLFGDSAAAERDRAVEETRNVSELLARLRNAMSSQHVTDDRVWDAVRLGIARVATLGIVSFDSPIANDGLVESAESLRGMQVAIASYQDSFLLVNSGELRTLQNAFSTAIDCLAAGGDDFDRLQFIASEVRVLADAVLRARRVLGISVPDERRAFQAEAASVYDVDAFDPQAFAAPATGRATDVVVALGSTLFRETRLSGRGNRSCVTCHDPARAFTDGQMRSVSLGDVALRNAPTLINAGLQAGTFYDLRTAYLEDQVTEVIRNENEMHGNLEMAATLLARDSVYRLAFATAFPPTHGNTVTSARIHTAIAAYVRSLTRLNSRVDRALRGESSAVDAEERLGFNLFMGKARCGTCHFAPLFNGTVPPTYDDAEVEVLGVPRTARVSGATIDPDSGRFKVTRALPHLHAFKTPTIRNIGLTAPYMHNGAYPTLESVVDFYDRGGGRGIGVSISNQTLPSDPLRLTAPEKKALVRFMAALTDTSSR